MTLPSERLQGGLQGTYPAPSAKSRLCETPSALWQRRFGPLTGTAPSTTRWGPQVTFQHLRTYESFWSPGPSYNKAEGSDSNDAQRPPIRGQKMGHRDKAHGRPHGRRLLLCNERLRGVEGADSWKDKAANSREHQVLQPKRENPGTRQRRP